MLHINGLNKSFGRGRSRTTALRDVSFAVETGQRLTIVGPSGSGKTTLLRCIAGLEKPDGGTIHINDGDVTNLPPSRRGVAFVAQDYALYPYLTVAGNLTFPLHSRGLKRQERTERASAIAAQLNLTDRLNHKPHQLSGGERQRLSIGRAIAAEAQILLLDEPFSQLDARLRRSLMTDLLHWQQKLGLTLVMVTHDEQEAVDIGDQVLVVANGAVIQCGLPDGLQRDADGFLAIE